MNLVKQYLGKVSITAEGKHDINKAYNRLCLVYLELNDTIKCYLSKKPVPKNVSLSNRDYWQPFAVNVSSGGGTIEEVDPYAVTDIIIRHFDDEITGEFDIPEAGTYLIGPRSNPYPVLIRLDDLDWASILTEAIPNISDIVSKTYLETFECVVLPASDKITIDVQLQDDGGDHLLDSFEIPLANSSKAGLISSEEKLKLAAIEDNATDYELSVNGMDYNGDGVYRLRPSEIVFNNGLLCVYDSQNEQYFVNVGMQIEQPEYESDCVLYRFFGAPNRDEVCTLQLDYATQENAGLMSAEDKTRLDTIKDITSLNIFSTTSSNGIILSLADENNEVIDTAGIPLATSNSAGIITPSEKVGLARAIDNVPINSSIIVNVTATGTYTISGGDVIADCSFSFSGYTYDSFINFVNAINSGYCKVSFNVSAIRTVSTISVGPKIYNGYLANYTASTPKLMLTELSIYKGSPVYAEFVLNTDTMQLTGMKITGL